MTSDKQLQLPIEVAALEVDVPRSNSCWEGRETPCENDGRYSDYPAMSQFRPTVFQLEMVRTSKARGVQDALAAHKELQLREK